MIPAAIREVFEALDAAGIGYVVLRGYLPLEELAESTDIDVFIAPRDRRRADEALHRAGWRARRFQTGRYPHRFYDSFAVPGRLCTMFDVVYGLYYSDDLYGLAGAERILATAERQDGVRVPHPWLALLTFALHVLLDKGTLSEQNARRGRLLGEACAARPDEAALVEREFGAAARALVERFGAHVGGDAAVPFDALRREALALRCLRRQPLRARLDDWRVRVRNRTMRPFRVAVLGMDGAGKSTLIEHAVTLHSPLPIGSAYLGYNQFGTRVFRWFLARIAALTDAGKGDGLAVRLLDKGRALWWPVDLYVRMRRAERGRAVVLYDRYPFPAYERDDEPTTLPGHVMHLYERLWTALLPRPDALLFLDGAPEVLWARKQEYPFAVFEKGRERYLRLVAAFGGERHVVATDVALDASKAAVTEALRTSPMLRRRLYRGGGAGVVRR